MKLKLAAVILLGMSSLVSADPSSLTIPETALAEAPQTPETKKDEKKEPATDKKKADKSEDKEKKPSESNECQPWWMKVPPAAKFPPMGAPILPPTSPGYYSLLDLIHHEYREKQPQYPYPRFGLIPPSFFDADFRYLDKPDNTEHDYFDFLKRIRLGDHWLFTTGGDLRFRHNSEVNSRLTNRNNTYDLFRLRAYGDLWYENLFRVYVEGVYADSFYQDLAPLLVDIDRGDFQNLFLEAKLCEYENQPIYLRVGRQELLYGSQRLISTLDWVNARRTFQGAKAYWHTDKWDVDVFAVQPVIPNRNQINSVDNDIWFSGVWVTHKPKANTIIDVYYLNLDRAGRPLTGRNNVRGGTNFSTLGTRYYGRSGNWLIDVEAMVQFGEHVNQKKLAQAFTAGLGYNYKECCLNPSLWFYYDFASGDPDLGNTDTNQTFNQLFPFGHYYFGCIDVVGRQNINDFNAQFTIYPTHWITLVSQYHIFRLNSARDALYNVAGVPLVRDPTGRRGTDVGEEIDLIMNFHLDKHQDIFVSYSHLFAGDFLRLSGIGSVDYLYAAYSYRW